MWKHTWMLTLAVALCGCFKTKDELIINADGSGSVRLETRLLIPSETLQTLGMGMTMGADEAPVTYPPTTEADAKRWFPAKDFKLTAKEDRAEDGGSTLVLTAEFKDVNALLASPYAKAHGLTLAVTNGALTLKALSGIEAAARLGDLKDTSGMFAGMMPSMEVVTKKKHEMRAEFRVTLPNAVSSANASASREGKTVTWTLDHSKQTNAAEFAQQAGVVFEAACSAEGVKFSPVTLVRLGPLPFKDAPTGAVGDKVAARDTNKIAAAVKFVPVALQVVRSVDLSGEGGSHQNHARLIGNVVLPRDLEPQKWGEAKLEEVVDEKGNNLKFEENDDASIIARYTQFSHDIDVGDDEDGEEQARVKPHSADAQRVVTLSFRPPDWKVRQIARVKGSIPLQYFGGAKIIKLSNAIPEKWIRVMANESDVDFDPNGKSINDPTLPETGLSLQMTMGGAQGPVTMLLMQAGGDQAAVTDGQVYDVDGRAWPTFFQKQAFGEESAAFSLMVVGRPKAPLSLALVINDVGARVDVPILLEKLAVGPK